MKIAYVIDTFPRRSELFVRREINELRRQRIEVKVFSLCRPRDAEPDAVYLPRVSWRIGLTLSAAVRVARAVGPAPRMLVARARRSPAIAELAAAVEAGSFDAIHAHFLGVASTIALPASQLTGVPLTISAHAGDVYRTGEALAAKAAHARAVFTCCRANVDELIRLGIPDEKLHVSYHGLPEGFGMGIRAERGPHDPFVILALGRFVEKKGFRYLIGALRELTRREEKFRCVIAGEGPLRSRLVREAADMGVTGRVEFPGWVDRQQKMRIYAGADVLVCPSVVAEDGDRDGVPNVIIEAAAVGLPVIATDAGGIPEMIEDESTGLVVPQRDQVPIADAISRIREDAGLRARITDAARARVEDVFDLERNVKIFTREWGARTGI